MTTSNNSTKKWYASEYGLEEVNVPSSSEYSNIVDITLEGNEDPIRVHKSKLHDTEEDALDAFKKLGDNGKLSKLVQSRYDNFQGPVSDKVLRDEFLISDFNTNYQPTDFDDKLVQDAKDQNNIRSFFKDKIKSFDVEATGLNQSDKDFNKRARIWQTGLAIEGEQGIESHTNPLKTFATKSKSDPTPMPILFNGDLKETLRSVNGRFSEDTYINGGFDEIDRLYRVNKLDNLDQALDKTLGTVSNRDILVLQNMNYENSILKSSREQNLISEDKYNNYLNNMYTTGNESTEPRSILKRPSVVENSMRKADLIYRTQFLVTNNDGSYNEYLGHLNNAITGYKDVIDDPNRNKAVAVELQDITKYFLGHAANRGYIDKNKSTLGLNVDFLSRAILDEKEQHTALSDATQTITLMKRMMSMGEELESGNVSPETQGLLRKFHSMQKTELDRGFLSSISSIVHDFKTKGHTRKSGNFSFNTSATSVLENGKEVEIPGVSLGNRGVSGQERSLNDALDSMVDRYDSYGEGSIDKDAYVEHLKEEYKKNTSFSKLHDITEEDVDSFKKNCGKLASGSFESKLNKKTPISFKKKALIGAGIGLAYMWMTPNPGKQEKDYSSASEDYYNDQYLGTEFVNYKERNKHYMM